MKRKWDVIGGKFVNKFKQEKKESLENKENIYFKENALINSYIEPSKAQVLSKFNEIIELRRKKHLEKAKRFVEENSWIANKILKLIKDNRLELTKELLINNCKTPEILYKVLKITKNTPVLLAIDQEKYYLIEYYINILQYNRFKFLLLCHNKYEIIKKFVGKILEDINNLHNKEKDIDDIFKLFLSVNPLDIKEAIDSAIQGTITICVSSPDEQITKNPIDKIKQILHNTWNNPSILNLTNKQLGIVDSDNLKNDELTASTLEASQSDGENVNDDSIGSAINTTNLCCNRLSNNSALVGNNNEIFNSELNI